nr:MAG TPA: hypothetical protein [Caudoviricetes sp.]
MPYVFLSLNGLAHALLKQTKSIIQNYTYNEDMN